MLEIRDFGLGRRSTFSERTFSETGADQLTGNTTVRLQQMRNGAGESITVAQGNPVRVWIPLPARFAGALLARVVASSVAGAAQDDAVVA